MKHTQSIQLELAKAIRQPEGEHARFEKRRLKVYQELFYNNVLGFCDSVFPVLKSILGEDTWRRIVRDFFVEHHCETPHFSEISQEFLSYLATHPEALPSSNLLELAHYEWVELAVSIAQNQQTPLQGKYLVPESTWPLAYSSPVQQMSAESYQTITAHPTFLIVYRDSDFAVKFVESDQLAVILLTHMKQKPHTKQQLIEFLGSEHIGMQHQQAVDYLSSALAEFCRRGIVIN